MLLRDRLLSRHDSKEVDAILGILANPETFQPVIDLGDGEEITVSGGHRSRAGHQHRYDNEVPSLAGEGATPIGPWEKGTHTFRCACTDMLHVEYRARFLVVR